MEAELYATAPGYCHDGGLLELSVDEGPWEQIFPVEGYTHRIRAMALMGPFPCETEVYSGQFDWREACFAIEGEGDTGRIRFRFGSNYGNGLEGWYIDDVMLTGSSGGAAGVAETIPLRLRPQLYTGRPNPFRAESATRIEFELPAPQPVTLQIFDPTGRLVRTLVAGELPAGCHQRAWRGCDERGRPLPSGVYLTRLVTPLGDSRRPLILLR